MLHDNIDFKCWECGNDMLTNTNVIQFNNRIYYEFSCKDCKTAILVDIETGETPVLTVKSYKTQSNDNIIYLPGPSK